MKKCKAVWLESSHLGQITHKCSNSSYRVFLEGSSGTDSELQIPTTRAFHNYKTKQSQRSQ